MRSKLIITILLLILGTGLVIWSQNSSSKSQTVTPPSTNNTHEQTDKKAPDQAVHLAIRDPEQTDKIQLITYDIPKKSSNETKIITVPGDTALLEEKKPFRYRSYPVQFSRATQSMLILVEHKDQKKRQFYSYDLNNDQWQLLLETQRVVENWLFDEQQNILLLVTAQKDEKADHELFFSSLTGSYPLAPEKITDIPKTAHLQRLEQQQVILIDFINEENQTKRILYQVALAKEAQIEKRLILSTNETISDSPTSLSGNLQYYAFWSRQGIEVRNLITEQTNLISRQNPGSTDVAWSPQGANLIYSLNPEGTRLRDFVNNQEKSLYDKQLGLIAYWGTTDIFFYLQQGSLAMFDSRTKTNEHVKNLKEDNFLLGIK